MSSIIYKTSSKIYIKEIKKKPPKKEGGFYLKQQGGFLQITERFSNHH